MSLKRLLWAFSLFPKGSFPWCVLSSWEGLVLNVVFQLELGFLKAILGVVSKCSCSHLLIFHYESVGGRNWLEFQKQYTQAVSGTLWEYTWRDFWGNPYILKLVKWSKEYFLYRLSEEMSFAFCLGFLLRLVGHFSFYTKELLKYVVRKAFFGTFQWCAG